MQHLINLACKASFFLSLLACFCSSQNGLYGQGTIGNNPLSRFGLGEQMPTGNTRDLGMGNATMALPSADFQNQQNPALSSFNRATNFEMGLTAYRRYLADNSFGSKLSGGGGPAFVKFSFPVSKRSVLGIGMRPNTFVSYNFFQSRTIQNDTTQYTNFYIGNGGTTRAGFSWGYTASKTLSLGLSADYLFGTMNNFYDYKVNQVYSETTQLQTTTRVSQLVLKPGVFYRINVDTAREVYAGLSAYYETAISLNSKRSQFLDHLKTDGSNITYPDTLQFEQSGNITLPSKFGLGFGLQRPLHWGLGLDFNYSNWANFRTFSINQGLKSWYSLGMGAEWLPNYLSTNFFNRITYRSGLNYQKTPTLANGLQLDDFSISLGVSMPITRKEAKYTRPFLNLALVAGRRGSLSQNDFTDTYYRIQLSISLNDLMWFNRYKVD